MAGKWGLTTEESRVRINVWLKELYRIAFHMTLKNQLVSLDKHNTKLFKEKSLLLLPSYSDCFSTFLTSQSDVNSSETTYRFIHLSQQYYLAAQYVCQQLLSDPSQDLMSLLHLDVGNVTDTNVGNVTDTDVGNVTDTDVGSNTDTNVGNVTDTDVGSNTDKDVGSNTDKDVGSNTDTDVGSNTDTDVGSNTDTDVGSNTDTNVGSNTDTDVGSNTDKDVGSNTDTDVGSNTDTDVGSNTDTDVGSNTDTNVGSNTDTDVGSNTDTDVGSNTDTDVGSNTDTDVGSNTDTDVGNVTNQSLYDQLYEMMLWVFSILDSRSELNERIVKTLISFLSHCRRCDWMEVVHHAGYSDTVARLVAIGKYMSDTWYVTDKHLVAATLLLKHTTPSFLSVYITGNPNSIHQHFMSFLEQVALAHTKILNNLWKFQQEVI
ncbi:hypothetical protein Pmani_002592 [Petrolisthes manimaculis]|uniref:Uncharacterized protein n=1 Tax=Petrolisthes manimaculis TaxID=1843537 RepID=A0AAE1QID8_9EUCA|nr:hypothetical protein Pmani_002592 [Petrolisthes manimaculis]